MISFTVSKRRISGEKKPALYLPVIILCLLFIAASLLLESYLHLLSGHEHSSINEMQSCTACVHIDQARKLLRMTAAALKVLSSCIFSLLPSAAVLSIFYFLTESSTPVSRKVRLNN